MEWGWDSTLKSQTHFKSNQFTTKPTPNGAVLAESPLNPTHCWPYLPSGRKVGQPLLIFG